MPLDVGAPLLIYHASPQACTFAVRRARSGFRRSFISSNSTYWLLIWKNNISDHSLHIQEKKVSQVSFRVHTEKYYFITQREKLHIQAHTTQNIIFYSWLNFQHMGLGLTLSHLWNTLGAWPGFIKPNHPSVYLEWQSKKYKKGNLRDRQQSLAASRLHLQDRQTRRALFTCFLIPSASELPSVLSEPTPYRAA